MAISTECCGDSRSAWGLVARGKTVIDCGILAELEERPPVTGADLVAANINPATGLATDYLNHFNEITMLIGLVGDMPEMLDEIRSWQPATYEQHFERSTFTGKALALAAYRAASPRVRRALDDVVRALDGLILHAIAALDSAAVEDYRRIVAETDRAVRPLMGRASGVIHGVESDDLMAAEPSQDAVDALMG
jgi:hypothetical protein